MGDSGEVLDWQKPQRPLRRTQPRRARDGGGGSARPGAGGGVGPQGVLGEVSRALLDRLAAPPAAAEQLDAGLVLGEGFFEADLAGSDALDDGLDLADALLEPGGAV